MTRRRRRRRPASGWRSTPAVDLVVLDRMLPGRDGLEVLAAIRRTRPALPVIMLTAKGEVADRVEGLDLGATDYVTKPFAFDELLARIRARLRDRRGGRRRRSRPAGSASTCSAARRPATGSAVRLPEREADLLAYLMRHAGPGLHARGDPRRGLGLRPRPRHERRPGLRRVPAPQARPARVAGADRDGALGRLPARASRMRRAWARLGLRGQARALDRGDRRRSPSRSSSSPSRRDGRTSRT